MGGKLLSAFQMVCMLTALFWGLLMLLLYVNYGGVPLKAPVQSFYGFYTSSLAISIGEYFVLFFIFKIAIYYILFVFLLFVNTIVSNPTYTYICLCLVGGSEYLIYTFIPSYAKGIVWKYVNICYYLDTVPLVRDYLNMDISDKPVSHVIICICGLLVLLIVGLSLCLYIVSKEGHMSYTTVHYFKNIWKKTGVIGKKIFSQEAYKFLYGNKIAFLILFLIIGQAYLYSYRTAEIYDDERYYKEYMEQLEGPVTEGKVEYIKSERERIDKLEKQIDVIEAQYENGQISQQKYESLTSPLYYQIRMKDALIRVEERLAYLQNYNKDTGKTPIFIYETGYNHLIGAGEWGYSRDIYCAFLLVAISLFFYSGMWSGEQKMMKLLSLYPKGYQKIKRSKITLELLGSIFTVGVVYVPEWLYSIKNYGLPDITQARGNIPELFGTLGITDSILEYLILVLGIRIITLFAISFLLSKASYYIKNQFATLLIGFILLGIPIALSMTGMDIWNHYIVTRLLSGNMILR